VRLGVALEVRAPRNHDAAAIERTITPSDPPTNLTALRRPKYRQNGKRMPGNRIVRHGKCLLRGICREAGKREGTLKDGPSGYGKKEGDMLVDCRGKMHHQTMRLSVVNAACTKSMSCGIQETDDWMLKWDGGGNSTFRTHDLAADTFSAHTRITSLQQEHAH